MKRELNIVKWNIPNWEYVNCYLAKEIAGEVGDIVEDVWIVIDGGKHVVRLANLTLIDIIETNFPLEHPYLEFDCMTDNLQHRYHVNHSEIKKVLEKKSANKKRIDISKNIRNNKISKSHSNQIFDDMNKKYSDNHIEYVENIYKLGQAQIMAFLLRQSYNKDYKADDIRQHLRILMDNDKELKEYVYEIMKDY